MTATIKTGATALRLPIDGVLRTHVLGEPGPWRRPGGPITSRIAYAAAHVVPKATADNSPGAPADLDWDITMAYRHELWSYGLGVADAMDTAQRGMGLDWTATRELIARSGREAAAVGGRLSCGAGTDQLVLADIPGGTAGLVAITDAYRAQIEVVREAGAQVIMMASRALATIAESPADYQSVYGSLLAELDRPVILHWLGDMFDPALRGYWGSTDIDSATATFRELIETHADKVDGVKVSLLDAGHEVALRRALPAGVRLYTGDDFNYPELIIGDETGHSDALLGIFAAIYPAASTALQELDAGDSARAHEILASTQELGRHIFAAPTYYYKTGIAFLSWLNGHQPGFAMVNGLASGRSVGHLCQLFVLADRAGLLADPVLAAARMRTYLALNGVDG
ncbi:dihydrodipicolinate synthase family protein [Mycobacterium frederiksbergense]|uniref:dihydrodipicolinate synthase family protein n=1 Tax=Mycolicibacterium frederiksbergense TaxID=117567 RepID=UPI0021F29840|nr:dihydrodipicolinate synthase family protein [Mycolicibacterium frederiksbergense]MCV7047707.1 dihydrodipicolinate synthase family protein [Mycolicibacterium frederiksbergense]